MNSNKRPVSALFALGLVAAMPLAFAQQGTAPGATQDPSTAAAPAQQAAPATDAGGQNGLTWADLDADGNGSLSKAEATRHTALSNVFAEADADGNGELTAEEYRSYFQKRQAGEAAPAE